MEEALYRKYRPQTFADVTDQHHVKVTIQNQLRNGTVAHAYLFTGPRGIGKTTFARLLAKAVNCEKPKKAKTGFEPCNECQNCLEITRGSALDVMEIDAASHTGVDNVRENIIESVRFAPARSAFKVFIIDEVHMLSASSFNALLKTLEEPPRHAMFILATTEIHKVPETIISRCQRFDFRKIAAKDLVTRLKMICGGEGVKVDDDVLAEVARHAEGCARDAESLLGQILALGEKHVSFEEASLVLPAANTLLVADLVEALTRRDAPLAIRLVNEYAEQGIDPGHFLEDLVAFLRSMLFIKLGGLDRFRGEFDKEIEARVAVMLKNADSGFLLRAIEAFLDARRFVRSDKIPQLSTELAIMSLCQGPETRNFPEGEGCFDDGREDSRNSKIREIQKSSEGPKNQRTEKGAQAEKGAKGEIADLRSSPYEGEVKEGSGVSGTFDASQLTTNDSRQTTPPIQAKAVAFDSIPVVDLADVKQKWPDVFKAIQECNASLPLVLQGGEVTAVRGDEVELTFAYELHVETLNKVKNKQIVEEVMKKVLGAPMRLSAKREAPADDDTVSDLVDAFGGQVVSAEGVART